MEIIPAIDIIDGKCVRLYKGDYSQKTIYGEDPVKMAQSFEAAGLTRLHLVDLDGAKAGHVVNLATLKAVVSNTNLTVDFGGGVKTSEDLEKVLDAGAKMVTAGSIAVKSPETVEQWLIKYGADKIILGADVKDKMIAVSGWMTVSESHITDFLQYWVERGVKKAICTDISKDGTLQGPAFELYQEILAKFPSLELIASGGISNIEDIKQLKKIGMAGAITGKAIYENRIKLEDLIF